jgi:hypothetical protein
MKSNTALVICALVSWGAIAAYLFMLHRRISKLETKK